MLDTTDIFRSKYADAAKLRAFGFADAPGGGLVYAAPLLDGLFTFRMLVKGRQNISVQVFDRDTGDEYVLIHAAGASGAFVGRVIDACNAQLRRIADACFDTEIFHSDQAKAVIDHIRTVYGCAPEFLWKKLPDNAAFRRPDNGKWFAVLLTVRADRLGLPGTEKREILDLKLSPEEAEALVDGRRYFPGYHMNKKHWCTICMDQLVPTQEIFARIAHSWQLAK